MAINFEQYLSPEQIAALKQQRLQQLAVEAWGHEQNRLVAEAKGDVESAANAVAALDIIETAIGIAEQ